MPTSGVTTFSLTARDVVSAALDEHGILANGEEPSAEEMAKCIRTMNAMLKSWQLQGVTWKLETITVTGAAATAATAMPAYVRDVVGVRYVQSATNERQLGRWERDEYYSLPNKASAGTPSIYTVARDNDSVTVTVWPVPAAAWSMKADVERKIETVTDETDILDVPEELTETVFANLAVRCGTIFQVQAMPELAMRAQVLERQMFDNYRPASYFMGPM